MKDKPLEKRLRWVTTVTSFLKFLILHAEPGVGHLFFMEIFGIQPLWSKKLALRLGAYDGGESVSLRVMELNLGAEVWFFWGKL